MHHAGLVLLLLVALVFLGPLAIQSLSAAAPLVSQVGQMVDSAVRLVNLSALAALLAVAVAGLLALAILKLIVGF